MKILKKAAQKNVEINTDFYKPEELKEMFDKREVWFLDDIYGISQDYEAWHEGNWRNGEKRTIWLPTDKLTEIKVIYNFWGSYETIGVGKNGENYHIRLG